MHRLRPYRCGFALNAGLLLILSVCKTATGAPAAADAVAVKEIVQRDQVAALRARQRAVDDGFGAFRRQTFKELFAGGVFIVNGDTPVLDEQELREFYNREVATEWKSSKFGLSLRLASPELLVDAPGAVPNYWDKATRRHLSYCVSRAFGADHARVVAAIANAAKAWEGVSDVKFVYQAAHDGACTAATKGVLFDVRPVDVQGKYLARAFFPRTPRPQRNVLIDKTGLTLAPGKLTLEGILRHELGHVLSYRHEHTRPEAGMCFEDGDTIPLTDYDNLSVMHYPQCNGLGDWSLTLTERDKFGAACLYGAAAGYQHDPAQCRAL